MSAQQVGPAVLVADDHELVAMSLVLALRERRLDAHRCPVTSAEDILAAAGSHQPGVVLLDLDLDGVDGADLVSPLAALGWAVLVVTGTTRRERVAAAVAHGAEGWVRKSGDLETLLAAVDDLLSGRSVLPEAERAELTAFYRAWWRRERGRRAQGDEAALRLERLSERERQVLEALAEGKRAAAIAGESVVSVATVRAQIRSVLTKLDVDSQLAAVALLNSAEAGSRRLPA
jgi:DNA-binding NarL/FixJ family response regulator